MQSMNDREKLIPRIEKTGDRIKVVVSGIIIAATDEPLRVSEYGIPPVYYIPEKDVKKKYFQPSDRLTNCPWKGDAVYFNISVNDRIIRNGAWQYPEPKKRFERGTDHIGFYTGKMDECYLNDKKVNTGNSPNFTGWIIDES